MSDSLLGLIIAVIAGFLGTLLTIFVGGIAKDVRTLMRVFNRLDRRVFRIEVKMKIRDMGDDSHEEREDDLPLTGE